MFSRAVFASADVVDAVAPEEGAITSVEQIDNNNLLVNGVNPTKDADGSRLTGLASRILVWADMVNGKDPFTDLTPFEIYHLPGVGRIVSLLEEGDAGAVFAEVLDVQKVPAVYSIALFFSDNLEDTKDIADE